jgi:NAD(P)H-hydrate epimerase
MKNKFSFITIDQMKELDRLMINEFGISLIQMMENAGRTLAQLSQDYLPNKLPDSPKISILCGSGNNGGGGMVAARHLSNRGFDITVVLMAEASKLKPIPEKQWNILSALPVRQIIQASATQLEKLIAKSDLLIDAMIGYGLKGALHGQTKEAVKMLTRFPSKIIISLDAPSGFKFDKKMEQSFFVQARATLTLALPKVGMDNSENKMSLGDLYLGDISVPAKLYDMIGLPYSDPFQGSPYIRIS